MKTDSNPTPIMATRQQLSPPELEEEIRCRAYELYEQRGRLDGNDLDDWLQAETDLLGQRAESAAA